MKDHPEWKIVDSQSGDFTQAGGQQVMESYLKSYPGQFNVVVCQNDNEAYGAMDAMDAAGVTYGVGKDVTLISYDATHAGLQDTLDGKINCNVECNPIQAGIVKDIIMMLNERLMNMYRYHGFGEKLVEVDGDYSQRLTRAIELVDRLMGGAQP